MSLPPARLCSPVLSFLVITFLDRIAADMQYRNINILGSLSAYSNRDAYNAKKPVKPKLYRFFYVGEYGRLRREKEIVILRF